MNGTLATAASALHDLGLVTSVGGSLYGRTGLHAAVRSLPSADERGQITRRAWRQFTPLNLFSHVVVGLTWWVGRSRVRGRKSSRQTRRLVSAKDLLVSGYLASGLASIVTGNAVARSEHGAPLLAARQAHDSAPGSQAQAIRN